MNDRTGLRAAAQLVGVAAALGEIAEATGHHALARRARTAVHAFTLEVVDPSGYDVAVHQREITALLAPAVVPVTGSAGSSRARES